LLIRRLLIGRPAGGSIQRRSSFFIAAALLAPLLLAGCSRQPPAVNLKALRSNAHRAIDRLRGNQPKLAGKLEALLNEAERQRAVRRSAPFWRADPEEEWRAWNRLAVASGFALTSLERQQASAHERYLVNQKGAHAALGDAAALMDQPGMGRREAEALAQARGELQLAERLAQQGDFAAAADAARRSKGFSFAIESSHQVEMGRLHDRSNLQTWRQWALETITTSRVLSEPAIIVDKLRRKMYLYSDGRREAVFSVELGSNGLRPKLRAGDRATPEGLYRVVARKQGEQTAYYKALLLDYPNANDRRRFERARRRGLISRWTRIGGSIEIHGGGGQKRDWTDGCVALSNRAMDKLFAEVRIGTPVTIVGALPRGI